MTTSNVVPSSLDCHLGLRRLLVVSPLFPNNKQPSKGVFVKQSVLQLRNHFDVRVVSPIPWASRLTSAIPHRDLVDGIEVWYPPYMRIPRAGHSLDGFFYCVSLLTFMKKFVDRYPCDAILAHWAYPDAFGVTLINQVLKKPMFIQVHGSDINWGARSCVRRKMIAFALRRARTVFSVAYDLQEKMMALGIDKARICVAPNGADHAAFRPRDRDAVRAQLGLPLQKKIILFVGNLIDVKGLSYLIESAALLAKQRKDLLFIILGEGPRKEALQHMILKHQLQDDVRLLGGKPHEAIPYWMNGCDLFCLPSLSEGCPTVVVEALASGRPVVGTEVGDVAHLLKMPAAGYAVRPGDSHALADAIAKTLARAWDPGVLSRSVHELTWENTARRICARMSAELQGRTSDRPGN